MDEIFTDLCRQMLRRDDAFGRAIEEENTRSKEHAASGVRQWRRRSKRSERKLQCVLL